MGLFDFLKKSKPGNSLDAPSGSNAITSIYNLLFCDNLSLYKAEKAGRYLYPLDILFSSGSTSNDLIKIVEDASVETRYKILAYNRLKGLGVGVTKKELLGVIVEIGLDKGLDVLASYKDSSARYINHTGKMLIWDAIDLNAQKLTEQLFKNSQQVVDRIGVWDKERRPPPQKGITRITFLVSDGLYFGEGPTKDIFSDSLAGPALSSATALMLFLTQQRK